MGEGKPIRNVAVGDTARLRKLHPCGGRDWTVTRIGADIGLECLTCRRKLQLTREEFERKCTLLLSDNSALPTFQPPA